MSGCPVGAFTMLLLSLPLLAQRGGQPLPPDDPRLYQVFFYFCDSVSSTIQARKAEDRAKATVNEKAFARRLRIKYEELQTVSEISRAFVSDFAVCQSELSTYAERARALDQEIDSAVLGQFELRNIRLIDAAVGRLKSSLSLNSWDGLHAYINDEHRLNTSVRQLR